jgi:hypothetical protein
MRKRAAYPPSALSLTLAMARLTAASWETIWRRTSLMARGACSPAEYRRMTTEKVAAVQTATRALMRGKGQAAMLAPFVSRAGRNAKRLRRKAG